MLTTVDHLVVLGDIDLAVETYRRLGFIVTGNEAARGEEERVAVVPFGNFHIEFHSEAHTQRQLVHRSDDLDSDVERLRGAGFGVSEPVADLIKTESGVLARHTAVVESSIPVGLVEYDSETDRSRSLRAPTVHPNTATVVERVYLAVDTIDAALETFEQRWGCPLLSLRWARSSCP